MRIDSATIYGLLNCDGLIRYVGKTVNLKERVRQQRKERPWAVGVKVLEIVPLEDWQRAERRWIKRLRDRGIPLTNVAKGGNAVVFTPEVCAKIAAANRCRIITKETRQKLSSVLRGKVPTPDHRAHISQAKKGKTFTEQHKKALSQSRIGKMVPNSVRRKMSKSRKGKPSPFRGKPWSTSRREAQNRRSL